MLLNFKPPSPIYFIVQQFLEMVVEFAMRYAFLSSMESRDAVYTFLYRFNDFKNYWAAKCHDVDGQEALAAFGLRYKGLRRIDVRSLSEGGESLLDSAW